MNDEHATLTNGASGSNDKVEEKTPGSSCNVDTASTNPALKDTVPRLEQSSLANGNGAANGDHEKSDSEAETVVLDGKEEGATKNIIKREDASDGEGHRPSGAKKAEARTATPNGEGQTGSRKPSLKRKRVIQEAATNEPAENGNSSNLSSTFSSPAPQPRSDKGNGTDSDHRSAVAEDGSKKKGRLRKRKLEGEDDHARRRRGKSDPSSGLANGQERRRKRRVKDHDASSTRSESPPAHQHPRSHSTHSSSVHNGVKRRKAPPSLSRERRRKVSEETHPDSDDSTSTHHRPHLQKSASVDEHAMGKISHKKILDRSGRTPVARACANDNIEQLSIELKERPHHLNEPDYAQNNPLQIAALEGHTETVQFLLAKDCIVNCKNIDGDTPLIDAVENGHIDVVRQLLDAGADPRLRNGKGYEPLDLVNSENDEEASITAVLVAAKEKDPQRRPSEDHTTSNRENDLASVSVGSPTDSAQGKGAPAGSDHSRQGQGGRPSLGSEATRRKTARSQTTREGLLWISATPERLREAASKGDIEVVGHILNSRPADTESMLVAARGGHDVVLQLLIALGRNPEPDPEPLQSPEYKPGHNTPMLAAIGGGNVKVVELLLKQAGFDPTRRIYGGYTYYELAKQRQSSNWQQEYDILKGAYDNYAAETGRRSTHGSPREIRSKRPDSSSSPRTQSNHERPVNGLKRQSSHKSHFQKRVRPDLDDERPDDATVASDREAGSLHPPKPKIKSARSVSDAGSLELSTLDVNETCISSRGGGPPLQPRRRLLSKNQISDQEETKRRASLAAEKSPSSKHDKPRRKSSDASVALEEMKSHRSSSPVKHEGGKKRLRTSISPRSSISEPGKPHDVLKKKKKRRVDSQSNAIKQMQEESSQRVPGVAASMIASPESSQSPIFASGIAPVANMGGNSSFSPKARSPEDSKAGAPSFPGSMDRSRKQDSSGSASPSLIQKEPVARTSPTTNTPSHRSKENKYQDVPTTAKSNYDKRAHDREAQARKDERERQDLVKRETEIQAAREREAEAARQRQAVNAHEQEEARLKAQRETEEIDRQLQKEREEDEARETKKRNEDMLARRVEQERQQREKEERRRADTEHREEKRRMRLEEEKEQQRREALPDGLRRAAELSSDDARDPEWINKWLPLYVVETQDLDPNCDREDAEERWVANVQVAPILAIKDLELSQYTAWTHRSVTSFERIALWRLLKNQQAGARLPELLATKDDLTLIKEAKPKFFALEPLFWIRYNDFMDIVPRHPHLTRNPLYKRAMTVHHPGLDETEEDVEKKEDGSPEKQTSSPAPMMNGHL